MAFCAADEWHERVSDTLAHRRVTLGSFPVVDRQSRLIHLECPLRMQLEAGGAFEVAAHWLPLAVRSRLTPAADEHALALALEAIALDGLPRCVNLSPASLSDSGFATRLRTLLEAAPRAARSVWLEVGEAAAADRFDLTRELARQVRASGWSMQASASAASTACSRPGSTTSSSMHPSRWVWRSTPIACASSKAW